MSHFLRRVRRAFQVGIFAWVFCSMVGGPAFATDLNLQIQLSVVVNEPTTVVITGFTQMMPVYPAFYSTEIPAGAATASVDIRDVNPGEYSLEVTQSSGARTFPFTLNPGGTVLFDPSPSLQQEGNMVAISP